MNRQLGYQCDSLSEYMTEEEIREEIKRQGVPLRDMLPIIPVEKVEDVEPSPMASDGGVRHPGADASTGQSVR